MTKKEKSNKRIRKPRYRKKKDKAERTLPKTVVECRCTRRVTRPCSTCGTLCAVEGSTNPVVTIIWYFTFVYCSYDLRNISAIICETNMP